MIRGTDFSGWETLTDANAMANGATQLHYGFVRARDGYRDDSKFKGNLEQCLKTVTPMGAFLTGTYSFVAYHDALAGQVQAQNYWALIAGNAGSWNWQIFPCLDAEYHNYIDANGVRQVYKPPTNPQEYIDVYLMPQIEYLTAKINRRPLFYSNPDFILNYLKPVLGLAKNKAILECPLFIAAWTNATAQPSYWDQVKVFWPKWAFWQYKGDIHDWPGVSGLDLSRWPGTRKQLKEWLAGLGDIPTYDPNYNPGDIVPPDPIDPPKDDTGLTARVDALTARVQALETWRKS